MSLRTPGAILALLLASLRATAAESDATRLQRQRLMGMTEQEVSESNRQFGGLNFGVAVSVTCDTGARDRVETAVVDDAGIVRVDKQSNVRARVMLESHYFFPYHLAEGAVVLRTSGWGPFVAIQPGSDEIIDAVGAGMMFGWRRFGKSTRSFNLGVGFVVDPETKTLGEEFVENEPAPTDDSGAPLPIRYQTRDQAGILALASFAW